MPSQNRIFQALAVFLILYAASTLSSMAGMEIFGWTTAAAVLAVLFQRRDFKSTWLAIRLTPIDLSLAGLFLVIVLGAVFKSPSEFSKLDIVGSARWILLFFFLRAAVFLTWSDRISKTVITVFVGAIAIIGAYSVWQYFFGIDLIRGSRHVIAPTDFRNGQPIYRAEGLFGSSMTYGNSMAMSWCFAVAWLLHGDRKTWSYKLAAGASLLGLLGIFATMTRGVWLACAAALVVLALRSFRRGVVVLAASGALFAVISTQFLPELSARMHSIGSTTHSSNSARVQVWKANLEIFKENPVLGIGYGVNEDVVDNYYPRLGIENGFHGHAHNTFLQFLSGTGALGALCFAIFTFYFLWLNWQMKRAPRSELSEQTEWPQIFIEGALGAQIAMLIGGLTECNFKDAEVNHQFILILATLAAIRAKDLMMFPQLRRTT